MPDPYRDPRAHGPLADAGALLGRLLLGAIFVWGGFGKLMAASATIAYFGKIGLPVPPLAYAVTILVELVAGLMFVVGLFTRATALILAAWSIATALVAHSNFADHNMVIHFFKNVAICGGFIFAALHGPEGFSVDAALRARGWRPMVPSRLT